MQVHQIITVFSVFLLGINLATPLHGQVTEGQEILTLSGRENTHNLILSTQIATTISFPSDITLVTGYGLVLNAEGALELLNAETIAMATLKELAAKPVTIVHYAQAASDTLVVRAVRTGTPCYLTVRCGSRVFLFKLSVGETANVAVMVSDSGPGNGGAREVQKEEILDSRTNFTSTGLISILSRAKGRGFLETVNPELFDGWQERRGIALTSENDSLKSTITEIQQWPQKDALVFRCAVENKTRRQVRFKPIDVRVRAGDASYTAQLADSSGIVLPGRTTMLDLVLQGNAAGGKEHLSILNDFRLEIPIDHDSPPPNDLLPPDNPLLPTIEKPSNGQIVTSDMLLPLPQPSVPSGK
jgi:hypothetical protein